MHYEERVIDGVLHARTVPAGEWLPFTATQLTLLVLTMRNTAAVIPALCDLASTPGRE